MIRVDLPAPLRSLAGIPGQIQLDVPAPVTQRAVIDVIEREYPMLRGTIRDPATDKRRAFVRFYAHKADLSHTSPDELLPDAVASGDEPYLIVGAMAGG